MNNESPIVDKELRRQALDPEASFIVQAPAGSGKTELLIQRYLTLLAEVEAPEEIIAITFTRKAAGEMRNRVLQALEQAAIAEEPETDPARLTWRLGQAVLRQDRLKNWQLQDCPGRLRILTIDALCAALSRQLPLASGLGVAPSIIEDATALYQEAARQTLAMLEEETPWTPALERLLRHRDVYLADLERLIATMLARREQWLRHLATSLEDHRERLEQALLAEIEEILVTLVATLPQELEALLPLARFAASQLHAEGKRSPLQACLDLSILPGKTLDDLPVWRGVAELLLTKEGGWRKQVDRRLGFPAKNAARDTQQQALFAAMKTDLLDLIVSLTDFDDFRRRLHALRDLPPPNYDENQGRVLEALVQVLLVAAAQLSLIFQQHGQVDFAAVSQAALQALGEPEAPTDLALTLDYRIRHILVDEFQDTSLSQHGLLERLTAGWAPGDGRTLFVVGDPMQSIYRFREAEVGLYLQACRTGVGQIPLSKLTLQTNFRAHQGLVDWVNDSFTRIFPERDDPGTGAVSLARATAYQPALPGGAVVVHPSFDRDVQASQVAELVHTAHAEDPGASVAILVRYRSHLREILPQLKARGLRFRAVEIESLSERSVIQDLMALTRALVHPADRIAWLALLRAPWCGLSLVDLHALCGDEQSCTLWSLLQDTDRLNTLSEEGQQRLARVSAVLLEALEAQRRTTLRRRIEATWLALNGPACVETSAELEEAEVFFELLEDLDRGGDLADLQALEDAVGKLYAQPDTQADERLQIMTIHKAKGLEFDTVIVPGLERRPRNEDQPLLRWSERPRYPGRADLLLAPIKSRGGEEDPIYHYLQGLEQEKAAHERDRLLYVAVTRARKHLHLLGTVSLDDKGESVKPGRPAAGSLLAPLWSMIESVFVAAAHQGNGGEAASEVPTQPARPLRRLALDWQAPLPPQGLAGRDIFPMPALTEAKDLPVFNWAGTIARQVGTVVHQVLQRWGELGIALDDPQLPVKLRPLLQVLLSRLGMATDEMDHALVQVQSALQNTLGSQKGRWILSSHRDASSEYALSGFYKDELIQVVIDRTFIDEEGIRWIIDFKTSAHSGGDVDAFLDREQHRYRPQLEKYAVLMRQKEDRPVRLGLYFPLLQGWREWLPAGMEEAY